MLLYHLSTIYKLVTHSSRNHMYARTHTHTCTHRHRYTHLCTHVGCSQQARSGFLQANRCADAGRALARAV